MVRCSRDGGASGRWLELPVWMFDRASCTAIHLAATPQADLAALRAMMALLQEDEARRSRIIECSAFRGSSGLSRSESERCPCE